MSKGSAPCSEQERLCELYFAEAADRDGAPAVRRASLKNGLRIFVLFLLAFALMLPFSGLSPVLGGELEEAKDDLKNVQTRIDESKGALEAGKQRLTNLTGQMRNLEQQIYNTEVEIEQMKLDINETKLNISDMAERLERVEGEIDEQNMALNARLRAMYKNGDIGMLSVLFGSTSMSDLLTNIELIKRIYDADVDMLQSIEERYAVVEAEKQELVEMKQTLLTQQSELEEKQEGLAADREAVEQLKAQVENNNELLEAQIEAFNEEAKALTAKILELQSKQAYIGGIMCWPAEASIRITSPFGMRKHPITKKIHMHTGVDIGAPHGSNIVAANTGTVIAACWNNSYGYMIMLDHGGSIVTLYAHCSQLLVKKNDVVNRGDVIAKIGSTGNSTGPHLHFEVRINGEYKDPLEYITSR
ncbi:MAG TPA: peptidoglycan DD-metalloendopeptidase family protein [Bacillota bacterium]|nr:peptidoglycan DD-metalloendopeptidase family protein [Bacillota bacterium]